MQDSFFFNDPTSCRKSILPDSYRPSTFYSALALDQRHKTFTPSSFLSWRNDDLQMILPRHALASSRANGPFQMSAATLANHDSLLQA